MPLDGVVVDVVEEHKMIDVIATGDVARLLGVPEPKIQDALRRNPHLSPPMERRRRRWRTSDVERLAAYFGVEVHSKGVTAR